MIFIIMDNFNELISKLLGKINLTKPKFFGLDSQDIIIVISPSFKIYGLKSKPPKLLDTFPFKKGMILNPKQLMDWVGENDYEVTFESQVPSIKRKLFQFFGDTIVESESREKTMKILVMEELEKSQLPDSIKRWAKDNPEKFIKNIEIIQEMLKK